MRIQKKNDWKETRKIVEKQIKTWQQCDKGSKRNKENNSERLGENAGGTRGKKG